MLYVGYYLSTNIPHGRKGLMFKIAFKSVPWIACSACLGIRVLQAEDVDGVESSTRTPCAIERAFREARYASVRYFAYVDLGLYIVHIYPRYFEAPPLSEEPECHLKRLAK